MPFNSFYQRVNLAYKSLSSIVAVPSIPIRLYSKSYRYSTMASLMTPQAAPSWDFSPHSLLRKTHELIRDSKLFYDSLVQIKEPTVQNLVKPYVHHENHLGRLESQLTFLQHVSSNKDLREASVKSAELLQKFTIEQSLRNDLFLQFDKVWKYMEFKEKDYDFELYKYVEKIYKDYTRNGLQLTQEKREKVKALRMKLASNMLEFSRNLSEQKEAIYFTKVELDGVSDSVLDQFEKITENDVTRFKVTFKYPDILPVLKTAKNAATRKLAYIGDQDKVPENEKFLINTLKIRNELAQTLGYSTYADYSLDIKMAKNKGIALQFLGELKDQLRTLGLKELQALKKIKEKECASLGTPYDGHYYIWDHRYYDNKLLRDSYNVDLEKISEYYPLEPTIKGMLGIYETLLKLKFVEEVDPNKKSVWHDDVKQLAVWDAEKCEFVGWMYFDLHPRDGKYGHAACFTLAAPYTKEDGTKSNAVTALVCNFSKPSTKKPSLLNHDEITTFFHELGHGIHDLVGQNRVARFNGPNAVPWDFVEAPSQMLEFWTWNESELSALSSHYKTGEKIPNDLVKSLIATKHVDGALFALRQLHFALFDMAVHTNNEVENLNLLELWNKLREEVSLVENGDTMTRGYNSFGHIMDDSYSAGYYGYMWSEVFAADMYYTRFAANPLDSEAGIKYRNVVLARGGLYDMKDNLHDFLGREPSKQAFLKELGLD
ncbi:ZYBA0S14-02630g1_1 [Zygosaccharomyces bailii CLIB 213]|uniref:ZYBA0S14-02630g1_1 n=1 Tax=Zygosaccharomyces bailii (strain CLIB 213 / ATCC 58445 / CBS 680 / BCRC 21525 / NBRC 1098 / NCYC 1416 / NRRL Y-2227) TaxID=1333698 RepID=A0A8J2XB59_ZYGB2|nr:ZYBA0S14-02630g1_1 [Zygosaccharomyces bailii CLIB 213]